MNAAFKSVTGEGRASLGASRCRAPAAQRRAVASKAENASCATARRSRLLRKSRAAANGPESNVRGREVKASAASVDQPSALFPPCRPSVRRSALLRRASKPRDRAVRKRRDRNRQQPPARLPEGVVCRPEVLQGAGKNVELSDSRLRPHQRHRARVAEERSTTARRRPSSWSPIDEPANALPRACRPPHHRA